jgi:hypothetical protein
MSCKARLGSMSTLTMAFDFSLYRLSFIIQPMRRSVKISLFAALFAFFVLPLVFTFSEAGWTQASRLKKQKATWLSLTDKYKAQKKLKLWEWHIVCRRVPREKDSPVRATLLTQDEAIRLIGDPDEKTQSNTMLGWRGRVFKTSLQTEKLWITFTNINGVLLIGQINTEIPDVPP